MTYTLSLLHQMRIPRKQRAVGIQSNLGAEVGGSTDKKNTSNDEDRQKMPVLY